MDLIIEIISSAIPAAIPILLAALGGLFTWHGNVFNISMEGMLLVSAFCAVAGSYMSSSWIIGLLCGIIGSVLISLLFSLFVLKIKAGEFVTGIAINTFALGATTYLLRQLFDVKGSFVSNRIQALPVWNIPIIENIPIISDIVSGHAFPVYIVFFLIIPLIHIVIYKTPFGLRLRASGFDSKVLDSVGVKSDKLKLISILICGVLCGIGGSFLSLGYMRMFTENMSNGRGWISLAIIILTKGNPIKTFLMCLLFGLTSSIGLSLQMTNIPSQFADMLPYATVLVALFLNSISEKRKNAQIFNYAK